MGRPGSIFCHPRAHVAHVAHGDSDGSLAKYDDAGWPPSSEVEMRYRLSCVFEWHDRKSVHKHVKLTQIHECTKTQSVVLYDIAWFSAILIVPSQNDTLSIRFPDLTAQTIDF
jgi:hypothetical protein